MIYDPYSRPFQEDPYPLYKRFRDEEPCAYNPQMDFYALFRFEDVWNATLDCETLSSSLGPSLENRGQMPGELFSIIGMDPPAHTKLRNVISRGFTPRPAAPRTAGAPGRPDSPVCGGPTFTTSAPRCASSCVAKGIACICSSASTRTPSSGSGARSSGTAPIL